MKLGRSHRILAAALTVSIAVSVFSTALQLTRAQGGGELSRRNLSGTSSSISAQSPDLQGQPPILRDGKVRLLLEIPQDPTSTTVTSPGADPSTISVLQRLKVVRGSQEAVRKELTALNVTYQVIDDLTVATNALIIEVNADQLAQLEQLTRVTAIYPEEPVERELGYSVSQIGAPVAWEAGFTGAGTRIAVIDDGIDYKHATFGGNASTTFTPGVGANAKVVGGYDFVGDLFDVRIPSGPGSTPIPDPDPFTCPQPYPTPIFNPIDTPVHHGTHVAAIAAGYGVDAAGNTYTGPYNTTVPLTAFRVGAGVAPEAQLLAYRVFGCYGSTSSLIVAQALERSLDPNGDGNPSDRVDVINMSLGSGYGSGYGPYQTAIDNAVESGVVVVASAGNSADSYFVVGNPGAVGSAISVAGTAASFIEAEVTSPASIARGYIGAPANFGAPLTTTGLTGVLELASPINACTPITNAAAIAGKIAVTDRGACDFVTKVKNAQNAGAIGVLMCNNAPGAPIAMGGTDPTITIPSLMLSQSDCNTIKPQIPSGVTVTLRVSTNADTIYTSSSRGPRRSSTASGIILKPDVAAPGAGVLSAAGNTGNGSINYSGTSMAAPHVSGVVALLRQQSPAWTPQQLKALVMNTAIDDIFVTPGQPLIFGPGRIGSGVVNVPNAMNINGGGPRVIAYDQASPELVSLSFGLIEAVGAVSQSRIIELRNSGTEAVTYNVTLQDVVTQPGTTASISASTVTVPANGTAAVTVTITADPGSATGSFRPDPSTAETQGGLRREWLSEVTGYVRFTAEGQPTLRIAYHAAPRPASNMQAAVESVDLTNGIGSTSIPLTGTGVFTGSLSGAGSQYNVVSVVTPYQLQHTSPNEPNSFGPLEDHADIQYVGISSDVKAHASLADAQIFFGIVTHDEWATPKEIEFDIYIDTNRDGLDDFLLYTPRYSVSQQPVDIFLATLLNLNTGAAVGIQDRVNPAYGPLDALQTYLYNTNVITVPVSAGSLGLVAGEAFNYRVETLSYEYGSVIDSTPTLTYNPTTAPLDFSDAAGTIGGPFPGMPWYVDYPGADNIPVAYDLSNTEAFTPIQILLLHHHNAGNRAEVLSVNTPPLQRLRLASICPTVPGTRKWRVQNPNIQAVPYTWYLLFTSQNGSGVAPGARGGVPGEDFFETPNRGANAAAIFVKGRLQDVAVGIGRWFCVPESTPTPTPTNTLVPTNTPSPTVTPQPTVPSAPTFRP